MTGKKLTFNFSNIKYFALLAKYFCLILCILFASSLFICFTGILKEA